MQLSHTPELNNDQPTTAHMGAIRYLVNTQTWLKLHTWE